MSHRINHRINHHSWEWDSFIRAEVAPSQRATTSSRHGSTVFRGTVWKRANRVVMCERCGSFKFDFVVVHSPHFNTNGRRIDCVGREVTPV